MGGKKKGQKCRGQPSPPRALSDRDIETCRLADHAIEERVGLSLFLLLFTCKEAAPQLGCLVLFMT
eukprot:1157659-Pelagomonas_calceolata.AAC.11